MNNFNKQYNDKLLELRYIVHDAKVFIIDNHNKLVSDQWMDLSIFIKDGMKGDRYFYGKLHTTKNKLQIPIDFIKSFKEPVLDDIDGDFSVTINDIVHYWIDDRSIINIASYLEKKLNIT